MAKTLEAPAGRRSAVEPWEPEEWGEEDPPLPPPRLRRAFVEWGVVFMLAVLIALFVRVFFLDAFVVRSDSMEPTLWPGDRILVSKNVSNLKVGDIVVIRRLPFDHLKKDKDTDLVKRIIGLPGDTIWSVGSTVYVNGRPLAEPWLPSPDKLGTPITPTRVQPNTYYVLGDNRKVSYDSRELGNIPSKYIIGRVIMVVWHDEQPSFHRPG